MKIKRFFAQDIRQAMRMVREEQGPDAVILSNQRMDGGVEIVAAIDYDETLFRNSEDNSTNNIESTSQPDNERKGYLHAEDNETSPDTKGTGLEYYPTSKRKKRNLENNIWSQDPVLVEMRSEVKSLRNMLENQLASLAWGDLIRRSPHEAEIIRRLMKLGLSATLCRKITDQIAMNDDVEDLWQQSLRVLSGEIILDNDEILDRGGVLALIGPTGVGKTTTIAKLAARFSLRHGSNKVVMITIDNYRVAAFEQLRTYGRILDIPVKMAENRDELEKLLNDFSDRRLVLIDTAGMGQNDEKLANQLGIISADNSIIKRSLVLPATTRLSGLEDVINKFRVFNPGNCLLTKVDEATSLGAALSATIKNRLPISYISDGQQVPEDLHIARAHMLVSKSAEMMIENECLIEDEVAMPPVRRAVANANY